MKKLQLLLALMCTALFLNCTPDDPVEEHMYLQSKFKNTKFESGDEGDDKMDRDE